jgi:hypothetical protein
MLIFQSQDEHADEVMVATSVKSSGKGRVELVSTDTVGRLASFDMTE